MADDVQATKGDEQKPQVESSILDEIDDVASNGKAKVLSRGRSYGTVHGDLVKRYQQDGVFFDHFGNEVGDAEA